MKLKNLKIFLFSICYFGSVCPAFYRGVVYERFNEDTKTKQYVVLLSDIHFQTKALNLSHIKSMDKLLRTFRENGTQKEILFMAEDLASYEGDNQFIRDANNKRSVYYLSEENLSDIDGVNPLASLVRAAKEDKFDVINLEHRFLRSSIVPFTAEQLQGRWPNSDENIYKGGFTTQAVTKESSDTMQRFTEDSNRRKEKIKTIFNNSSQLAKDLKITEERWESFKKNYGDRIKEKQELLKNYDGTLHQFLNEKVTLEKRDEFLGSFLITDEDLLVIKALDGVANNPNKKKIIIAAGGLHIRDLEPLLEKMGFEQIIQEGKELSGCMKDNVDKVKAKFNQNHSNYQARMLNAKTVADMRSILGEDVSLVSDKFFAYVAFLGKK